jgi:uncharacterized membrane protein YfcA
METIVLILIGLAAGILSGLLGIGGATILIPALIIIYKLSQHMSQGTSLAALLLPVGLLATIKYWQAGQVNIKFAAFLAIGFLVGGYIGAVWAQPIPDDLLRKIFGLYLLIISVRMIFW